MNSLNLKKMKQIKTLTKSALLEMTLGGWLYIIKIFPNLVKIHNDKCKPVINHLRGEKNASLSFHKWKGKWYMKDFAQSKYKGDVFDLYAIVNNIDDVKSNFPEIIKDIYRDTFNQEASFVVLLHFVEMTFQYAFPKIDYTRKGCRKYIWHRQYLFSVY